MTPPRAGKPSEWAEHLLTSPDWNRAYLDLREHRMEHDLIVYLLTCLYPKRVDELAARDLDATFERFCNAG